MPRTVNPIRKAFLKKFLIKSKGTKIKEAMINAGYTKSTAERVGANTSVKIVQAEIERDILKETTVKRVIEELDEIRDLALKNKDYSTATRCSELKGKWLAMFSEKTELTIIEAPDNQFSLERLSRLNQKAIPQAVGKDE